MSAAATAAGYLYASGRLRGRTKEGEAQETEKTRPRRPEARREVKVAVYEPSPEPQPAPEVARPKAAPKIQYRTRRWKPE